MLTKHNTQTCKCLRCKDKRKVKLLRSLREVTEIYNSVAVEDQFGTVDPDWDSNYLAVVAG